MTNKKISNARERRKQRTVSEGLLWSIVRSRQLCGLKFRREHPIACYIVDFACEERSLVVEIDGGYHDQTGERDVAREEVLRKLGWDILRFTDKDVENDAEAVGRGIANYLGLEYSFRKRAGGGSGMKAPRQNRVTPRGVVDGAAGSSPKLRNPPSQTPKAGEE